MFKMNREQLMKENQVTKWQILWVIVTVKVYVTTCQVLFCVLQCTAAPTASLPTRMCTPGDGRAKIRAELVWHWSHVMIPGERAVFPSHHLLPLATQRRSRTMSLIYFVTGSFSVGKGCFWIPFSQGFDFDDHLIFKREEVQVKVVGLLLLLESKRWKGLYFLNVLCLQS